MRRFFSPPETFSGETVTLNSEETRHLRTVLRLGLGDEVSVFDGTGREYQCIVSEVEKNLSVLAVVRERAAASPESSCEITVAATVLSGEKYDLIIQKSVELGVVKLIPLHTIRCDVRPKDAARKLDRWRRIAMEATKQTGRAKVMEITEPQEFENVLADAQTEITFLFSERDGKDFSTISADKKITALFGPKGGWEDSELKAAAESGVKIVTLGGRILRAETASIAITAILQHRFGDLN